MFFAVLLRALVLFVIATPIFTLSPRVTTPDSFEYVFKDESLKLIKVDDGPVRELKDISTGVYSLKLAATRGGCGPKVGAEEYLGFNNRTCTSSLVPTKTAGPVMRGPSSSMMWREWMVTVKNKGDDRVDVSLQSFVHPAREDQGKCLGYVSNYYGNPKFKGSCLIPPYGNGLFLNGTENTASKASNSPQVLSMKAAGEGEFEITAANKPDECTRALAVEDCNARAVLVEDPVKYFTDSKKYTTWILTKRYDVVMSASAPSPGPSPTPAAVAPSPGPSPTPAAVAPSPGPPPPPAPIPGPRIEPYQDGQTVVTWGYIELVVDSFGGNNRCSVTTVVITVTNQASTPATYEIPASRPGLSSLGLPIPVQVGENSISAVGMCRNGESTERSQVLSVLYYPAVAGGVSSPPPPPPPPPGVTWTTQTSAADNSWRSVTWGGAAGSEKFVAVASTGTGNRVMTSADGVTWATQTSAADNNWFSVTWGGPAGSKVFVAVAGTGTGNRVMTSADGVTWAIQTSAADNSWRSVVWGGPAGSEVFVAVAGSGTGNRVMTSPNGVTWTTQTSASDNNWISVTWGGPAGSEKFVAVASTGTGNRVMTSPNGVTWTTQTSAADNNWVSVTWGGPAGSEVFVAVAYTGTGNRVMTSPNGVTWTTQTSAADNDWNSVTWGGAAGSEVFVAVAYTGTGNRVMTSPDGVTWTTQTSASDNSWNSVTWGGAAGSEKFVAVAASGTGNRVMTSP